ncbi:MAG: hypothetical protein R3C54_04585 [Parvularculaceae bacterium]
MKKAAGAEASGPVVVLALEDGQMASYQAMAGELRAAGFARKSISAAQACARR